jgi:peptidoglycan-associated lipoprotein
MTKRFFVPALVALAALTGGCGPKYPKCDKDENCHAGEYCVDGQCQECRTDAHCGPGKTCNAGRCEETTGYCTSDDACGVNEKCERNRCVTRGETLESSSREPAAAPSCELSPVYFDFDAAELDSSARNAISANVRCMKERGMETIQLTGHTDPRGTEEYNLALSDRRARAVKRYLVSLGVAERSLRSTGVGEEMAQGEDEASWRRDRRVDFAER